MNAKELANLMRKEAEISSKAYQQMILRRTARDIEKYIVPHHRPPQPSDDGKWCFLEQFSDLAPCLYKIVQHDDGMWWCWPLVGNKKFRLTGGVWPCERPEGGAT